jgi:hypothetical protein
MSDGPGGVGVQAGSWMSTPSEIKKALKSAGFEIYQTLGDVVHIAERVRENLIMDSGVRIHAGDGKIAFVVRAQRSDFPNEPEQHLFDRARHLGQTAVGRGYQESATRVTHVTDPGGGGHTLETFCEIVFEKGVGDLEVAIEEVRFALSIEKSVSPA